MKRIRTLVVEDQGMFRNFLVQWLMDQGDFEIEGAFESAEHALKELSSLRPDLMLVDLQLPGMDGLEFIAAAKVILPDMRALVLTSLEDTLALTRVHESGAQGYVEKNASPEKLLAAIRRVAAGGTSYTEGYHQTLDSQQSHPQAVGKILSRREQEVLSHMVAGRMNKEIADYLQLSVRTVEFHRGNLMRKLDAGNVAEVIARARREGLV
jgi:DNA-binding NarL/FixJ family response regulator